MPVAPIGSSSLWHPQSAEDEHDRLTAYLQTTAATQTIQNAMDLAVAAMHISPGARVLDVGCGTGAFLPRLAEVAGVHGSVAALDHVPGFLVEARGLMTSLNIPTPVEYVEGDALALPFADGSFDAAHTERVLIHLSDPDQGLNELRRVVKPGGWVACVEPDLDGMRIDHRDPGLGRLLVSSFTETFRFPAMGLELNRRMALAGFAGITIQTLTEVERDLPEEAAAMLRSSSQALAANGRLEPAAADDAVDWLVEQSIAGRYTSYTSMFIVAGRVP